MNQEERIRLIEILIAMSEIYGRNMSAAAATMFANDLHHVPYTVCVKALEKCRKELRGFPSVADIFDRVQAEDGRPGAQEAWAMIPKNESDSVVWTEEMAKAFGVCCGQIDTDHVAARMAFIEIYTREVDLARSQNKPTKWSASLGQSKSGREGVIKEAIKLGRLSHTEGQKLLPHNLDTNQSSISGIDFGNLVKHVEHK